MNKYEVRIEFSAPLDTVKADRFQVDNNNVLMFFRDIEHQEHLEKVAMYGTWLSVKMVSDE